LSFEVDGLLEEFNNGKEEEEVGEY